MEFVVLFVLLSYLMCCLFFLYFVCCMDLYFDCLLLCSFHLQYLHMLLLYLKIVLIVVLLIVFFLFGIPLDLYVIRLYVRNTIFYTYKQKITSIINKFIINVIALSLYTISPDFILTFSK